MKKTQKNGVPTLIGKTFAYIQHGMDRGIEWGFETLQETARAQAKKQPGQLKGNKFVRLAKVTGRGTLSFIGSMGSSYYKKYDELKQKKRED